MTYSQALEDILIRHGMRGLIGGWPDQSRERWCIEKGIPLPNKDDCLPKFLYKLTTIEKATNQILSYIIIAPDEGMARKMATDRDSDFPLTWSNSFGSDCQQLGEINSQTQIVHSPQSTRKKPFATT